MLLLQKRWCSRVSGSVPYFLFCCLYIPRTTRQPVLGSPFSLMDRGLFQSHLCSSLAGRLMDFQVCLFSHSIQFTIHSKTDVCPVSKCGVPSVKRDLHPEKSGPVFRITSSFTVSNGTLNWEDQCFILARQVPNSFAKRLFFLSCLKCAPPM